MRETWLERLSRRLDALVVWAITLLIGGRP
jgi:hypothetical protein